MSPAVQSSSETPSTGNPAKPSVTNIPGDTMSKDTSSSISKKSLEIPSLKDDGSNYNAWKFRQLTILRLRGLAGFIDGTDSEPAQLTGSDANDSTKIAERAELVKKWTA
ncbi:hypothetical protein OPQ81_006113 [Rhizoctonia solani]|nr:hypothetical protein OPQ81_006113 [Rhizoctonia solani]